MKKLCLTLLCATALTYGANMVSAQEDNTMPPPPAAPCSTNGKTS